MNECRVDLGQREARWHATVNRLRTRVDELEAERDEFKSRMKILEEERLSLQTQLNKLMNEKEKSKSQNSINQTLNAITQSICFDPIGQKKQAKSQGTSLSTSSSVHLTLSSSDCSKSKPADRLTFSNRLHLKTKSKVGNENDSKFDTASNVAIHASPSSGGGYFTGEDEYASLESNSEVVNRFPNVSLSTPHHFDPKLASM